MEGQKEITVLLVDDHQMMRVGLRKMINEQQNMTVIGEAFNGEEALVFLTNNSPDVIIMDVNMPIMDGIEATQKIAVIRPKAKIIGLSLHDSPKVKENMCMAGASAYLTKDKAFKALCITIRKVVNSKNNSLGKNGNDKASGSSTNLEC